MTRISEMHLVVLSLLFFTFGFMFGCGVGSSLLYSFFNFFCPTHQHYAWVSHPLFFSHFHFGWALCIAQELYLIDQYLNEAIGGAYRVEKEHG